MASSSAELSSHPIPRLFTGRGPAQSPRHPVTLPPPRPWERVLAGQNIHTAICKNLSFSRLSYAASLQEVQSGSQRMSRTREPWARVLFRGRARPSVAQLFKLLYRRFSTGTAFGGPRGGHALSSGPPIENRRRQDAILRYVRGIREPTAFGSGRVESRLFSRPVSFSSSCSSFVPRCPRGCPSRASKRTKDEDDLVPAPRPRADGSRPLNRHGLTVRLRLAIERRAD
jgi:hypothetical protein